MRITHYVDFYKKDRVYNPNTSTYDINDKFVGKVPCNVTDLGVERSIQLFGKYDINKKVVRPFERLDFNWSYLVINDTKYEKNSSLSALNVSSLVVGSIDE
ncbi:hypothetical protein RD055328_08380 [Companilactobacillus sp. RD055328]|uniref:hypothetical protein n=1 Tax=Companilactobacillus sp. RD055328 TaxID=2916634 RepID=UPI001FC81832|nr:hypothetical protein [Companilactobacillus sp. RD055328]GKQ42915.1 hypothetical protein RD055328_08380 [Companilactobacillus sp. RD055328]